MLSLPHMVENVWVAHFSLASIFTGSSCSCNLTAAGFVYIVCKMHCFCLNWFYLQTLDNNKGTTVQWCVFPLMVYGGLVWTLLVPSRQHLGL